MRDRVIVLWLAVLMLAVYLPSLRFDLVYDDLHWLPLAENWSGWDRLLIAPRLPWVFANWLGGGLPWGFHALAIGLHLLNGILFWAIARRWLSEAGAMIALALFWLWPTQVEAVAYASGANEALVTFYVLLAIGLWSLGGSVSTATSVVSLYLAASLKPSALPVIPVVALALATPWLVPVMLCAGLLLVWPAMFSSGLAYSLPSLQGLELVAVALWRYLWPASLSIEHDWSAHVPHVGPWALVGLVVVGACSWRMSWRAPFYAWLWIVGLTMPRGLVPNAPPLTEHHVYLPFLAIWLLCGAAFDRFSERSACQNLLPSTI